MLQKQYLYTHFTNEPHSYHAVQIQVFFLQSLDPFYYPPLLPQTQETDSFSHMNTGDFQ